VVEMLVIALAVLVVVLSLVLYRCAMKNLRAEIAALAQKTSESLDAGVKLLEVREFYQETSAEYQRMLNEAHRDGDRQRQDRMRRLIERLNTLKARALDRTTRLLEKEGEAPPRRRRRRPRRSRGPHPESRQGDPGASGPPSQTRPADE